jgi:hypothetical protein
MHRVTIQQFRAALAGRSNPGALVRAYRDLTRRPDLAAGVVHNAWALWTNASTPAAA